MATRTRDPERVQIAGRVTPELAEAFERVAAEHDRTMSAELARLIRQHVEAFDAGRDPERSTARTREGGTRRLPPLNQNHRGCGTDRRGILTREFGRLKHCVGATSAPRPWTGSGQAPC
jgi:hypothetical protein